VPRSNDSTATIRCHHAFLKHPPLLLERSDIVLVFTLGDQCESRRMWTATSRYKS